MCHRTQRIVGNAMEKVVRYNENFASTHGLSTNPSGSQGIADVNRAQMMDIYSKSNQRTEYHDQQHWVCNGPLKRLLAGDSG